MSSGLNAPGVVVIPAYNEAATVADMIVRVKNLDANLDVLVVNDGSTDATAQVAEDAGAILLDLPVNLGAWGAIQTGMRYAADKDYDYMVTMDADGQHLPETLPILIARHQGGADVVIGACVQRGTVARRFAWRYFRTLTRLPVADLTSGLRVYSRPVVKRLARRRATLLEYQDVGVLLLLRQEGFSLDEVAIEMADRVVGSSHIFRSWLSVAYYMLYTSVMSFSKVHRR